MLLGPKGYGTVRLRATSARTQTGRLPTALAVQHTAALSLVLQRSYSPCTSIITLASSRPGHAPSKEAARCRAIHQSSRRTTTLTETPHRIPDPLAPIPPHHDTFASSSSSPTAVPTDPITRAPLSVLPLSMILRSLFTTTISSSPFLLPPSLQLMTLLAHSQSAIMNPDRNPLLKYILKNSFYAQFCAGEQGGEVKRTVGRLKDIGFTGVIMGYAREVVLTKEQTASMQSMKPGDETEDMIHNEIIPWAEGTMETIKLAEPGDYVALKFTGAGRLALMQLQRKLPSSPYLTKTIDAICSLAQTRGVRLLFDAEQDALQDGIDDWTIHFAKKYNADPDHATIYGTYQAYKKCTPAVLSAHLNMAKAEGFTLGVKLVRGAYLRSDPRSVFHDTKADTDACFDSIAASVLTRQWGNCIVGEGEYPHAHLVLATHNAESVRRARAICDSGGAKSHIAFAQLLGMADEVSCELVEASLSRQQEAAEAKEKGIVGETVDPVMLPVYKYLVWGSTGECMKYLLRRAQENKEAVQRTRDGRDAMWFELVRRAKRAIAL